MKRRQFLVSLGSVTAASVIGCTPGEEASILENTALLQEIQKREFPSPSQGKSLHERAKQKGLFYGAFIQNPRDFRTDPAIQAAFKRDCGMVIGGVYWNQTRPTSSGFDWTVPNIAAQFAQNNQMLFRGHPLVWHKLYPKWMQAKLNDSNTPRKEIEGMLQTHISTIVRQYAGRTHSWDVVNEVVEPANDRPDGLRVTPWLRHLGVDYIDLAFRIAAEADSKAMLVLNDFALEYRDRYQERKRNSVLKLLEQLRAKGTPIHAFGMQSHLQGDRPPSALQPLRQFLSDVAALGLKIVITELDVADKRLPANRDFRDRIVASAYSDYLSTALDEKAVIGVITWGLSDRYTWLSQESPRLDKLPVRPLLLDEQMRPKFAWNAIARAFDQAPSR